MIYNISVEIHRRRTAAIQVHSVNGAKFKQKFREKVEATLPELYRRLRLLPFKHDDIEVKLRVYQDGHFFKMHMDNPRDSVESHHRTISFVYFFHKEPRPYEGGDLLLFDTDVESNVHTTSRITRLIPENNSVVFFPSSYWHCVIPLKCPSGAFEDSRFVINGHVHRKMREEAKKPGEAKAGETKPGETKTEATEAMPTVSVTPEPAASAVATPAQPSL